VNPKSVCKLLILGALAIPAIAQVPVTPIVQPRQTFVNADGGPCAGCSLYSYAAGTTTPLATYTDATGTSQNTNPIILDAAGGADIWLGANSYKLILKDATGATIWSVDKVNSGSLLPCASANAIQAANSSVNGLNCDPTITINTTTHTINIGTLPTNHVTIGALSTPTSWTFDTTSPATALASLGGGSIGSGTTNQIAIYPSNGNNVQGSSVIPDGITAITRSVGDNSNRPATTAYVAFPGWINPSSLQINSASPMTDNQGDGAKIQHAAGSAAPNHCLKYDNDGNAVDSGAACASVTIPRTCNANGCYRVDGDGTVTEWFNGAYSSSGYSGVNVTIPLPYTMPNGIDGFSVSTSTNAGGDLGESALFTVSSYTNSSITVFNNHNPDHDGNSIAPFFIVIGH